MRGNPRLSRVDRDVLEQHIDHMQTLQLQLSRTLGVCTPPDRPASFGRQEAQVNGAAQAQVDIAIAALRCGLRSIVNFYLDPDVLMTPELHGVTGGHHGSSHDSSPGSVLSIENAHKWHMGYLADFLTKLDDTVTADGTMLDDSLVLTYRAFRRRSPRRKAGATAGVGSFLRPECPQTHV